MKFSSIIFTLFLVSCTCSKQSSQSLAGNDEDHNGVRDDVDKVIAENYPMENETKAAVVTHKSIQQMIMNPTDPGSWEKDFERTEDCVAFLVPDAVIAWEMNRKMEAATVNTPERVKAYWKANATQSGKVFRSSRPSPEACR